MDSIAELNRLREEIERSLRRPFDPADILPRLARLARLSPSASENAVFAHRQLAELLVEQHPWRAAIYARRALKHCPDDDRAWAVLAFCQTLLGNFNCAAKAYHGAIRAAPGNPWYAHNLGHLLDVGLGAPVRALPWLRRAYGAKADNSEIVASYVHALARATHTEEARSVLELALARFASRELKALLRWLDQGAPSRLSRPLPQASTPSIAESVSLDVPSPPRRVLRSAVRKERKGRNLQHLVRLLERGLLHLPLDARQRERALALGRDALADAAHQTAPGKPLQRANDEGAAARTITRPRSDDVADLAAAVAYAIVYVDHVPLSHAEVAAPFRVAVASLRGRFAELRAKLDLIRGDARYATVRCS